MSAQSLIVIVDDDSAGRALLQLTLQGDGYDVLAAADGASALALVEGLTPADATRLDAILTDLNMPGIDGVQLCQELLQRAPDVPVIVVTAFGSLESAIAAMRAGAYDFLTKPFDVDTLGLAVRRAVETHRLKSELARLRDALSDESKDEHGGLLGKSAPMVQLRTLLRQVAAADATALITGESGTGKDVAAQAIHRWSRRSGGPFVAVNCAAMPESLLESELFGHVRGAFTDARSDRAGLLLSASGGTLLLDEIGDMPLGLQPKLLRALESRTVRPVGGSQEQPFDVRVVAATNRDLEVACEEGRFREDLFYRLNVLGIAMPPLRARGADVLLLAETFRERFSAQTGKPVRRVATGAAEKLLAYPWPGNVRELRNCIERAVALTRFDAVSVADLPEKIRGYQTSDVIVSSQDPEELVPLEEVERRYILHVLDAVGGNKSVASAKLGLNRKTLYRKLASYGVSS